MDGGSYISFMCFFLIELCITSIYFSLTQFSRLLGYLLSPSHSHQFRLQLIKSLHSLDDFSNLLQLLFTSQTKKLVSNHSTDYTHVHYMYMFPPSLEKVFLYYYSNHSLHLRYVLYSVALSIDSRAYFIMK